MQNEGTGEMARQPKKVKLATVLKAAERDDGTGYCLGCGKKHTHVEPDARKYECTKCEAPKVYGAAEIVLMCI